MHAVLRTFTGKPELADALERHRQDAEQVLATIPGFIAWYVVKTDDGTTTMTVCQDQAGCEESTRRGAKWVRENLPELRIGPPTILQGPVTASLQGEQPTRQAPAQAPGARH